ncbi:MAG: hypothetical protein HYR63_14065 [Proteobacteria bacterium]|nr:hypothetical protein [Pseudomonadota bacterium]
MDHDWVFLNKDGSKSLATLKEKQTPNPGDGKVHNGVGYVVRHVVTGRTTGPNPIVIATEQ